MPSHPSSDFTHSSSSEMATVIFGPHNVCQFEAVQWWLVTWGLDDPSPTHSDFGAGIGHGDGPPLQPAPAPPQRTGPHAPVQNCSRLCASPSPSQLESSSVSTSQSRQMGPSCLVPVCHLPPAGAMGLRRRPKMVHLRGVRHPHGPQKPKVGTPSREQIPQPPQ